MNSIFRHTLFFFAFLTFVNVSQAQYKEFFTPSDTFNSKRFNTAVTIGSATYAGFATGLYFAWYKQYPQEGFHLFNDWNEWGNMDKFGHLYSSYFQAHLCYKGGKWTGLSEDKAILTGIICSSLFQGTIEVMDGFSTNWGFSLSDMAFNGAGIGAFVIQQKQWGEQRIKFKVSSVPVDYSNALFSSIDGTGFSSQQQRADDLFGASFAESFLKDYNAQTVWASINIKKFLSKDTRFPDWLNLAIGYGSENMFGGFENTWNKDGLEYDISGDVQRYQQLYIGLDIDLEEIKTDNYFLKGILSMLNIFKAPSPAIEFNTRGEIHFHLFR